MHLSNLILNWYDLNHRLLPWRAGAGEVSDPYHVWLSEIMLQQTTVSAVIPYFNRFCQQWPTIHDLAGADLDDILRQWAGLGYYARARNLHACARQIVSEYGGALPDSEAQLLTLPGIGPYTAAAIAAIAYRRSSVVVDGNIERIMARLPALKIPLPKAKAELYRLASAHTPQERAGDYAQGLMDLGAQICRPKSPRCDVCPIAPHCKARQLGTQINFPIRAAKKPRPVRHGRIYWLEREDGAVLLRRRKAKGLLGGMMEFPSSVWNEKPAGNHDAAPLTKKWQKLTGEVQHVFTHFELRLTVYRGALKNNPKLPPACRWAAKSDLQDEALPSLMRKVVKKIISKPG